MTSTIQPIVDQAAVRDVAERIASAWAAHDADAFAETFTEHGSLILPGVYLKNREEIRAYMAHGFAGPYQGTRITGSRIGVKMLAGNAMLVMTQGGILAPGETTVAPEHEIQAHWLVVRPGRDWMLAAGTARSTADRSARRAAP